MTAPIAERKRVMRTEVLARRRAAAAAEPDAGLRLRETFLAAFGAALAPGVVSGFWPMADEIDVRPLLTALAARGWRTALPVVVGRGRPLLFRAWEEGDVLVRGPLGIGTPRPEAPEVVPDLVLTPLVAFDASGYRLGHGAGYYDMTLAGLRARGAVLAVGVAFDAQEVAAVPRERHDQRLDALATPSRVLRFAEGPA